MKPELLVGVFTNDSAHGTTTQGYFFQEIIDQTGAPTNPTAVNIELPDFKAIDYVGGPINGIMPASTEDLAISNAQQWRVTGDKFDVIRDTLHCKVRRPLINDGTTYIGPERKMHRILILCTGS